MDRVRQAEAARALGLNRSTVSRLVRDNPALADEAGLVNIDQIRGFREETLNPKLQTRGPAAHGAGAPSGGLNDQRARSEQAKAISAELDLAARLNLTLRRDDVESAIAAAGETMRQVGFQLARDQAERLAMISDVREMERALDDLVRELLTKGADALTLAVAPSSSAHAA